MSTGSTNQALVSNYSLNTTQSGRGEEQAKNLLFFYNLLSLWFDEITEGSNRNQYLCFIKSERKLGLWRDPVALLLFKCWVFFTSYSLFLLPVNWLSSFPGKWRSWRARCSASTINWSPWKRWPRRWRLHGRKQRRRKRRRNRPTPQLGERFILACVDPQHDLQSLRHAVGVNSVCQNRRIDNDCAWILGRSMTFAFFPISCLKAATRCGLERRSVTVVCLFVVLCEKVSNSWGEAYCACRSDFRTRFRSRSAIECMAWQEW